MMSKKFDYFVCTALRFQNTSSQFFIPPLKQLPDCDNGYGSPPLPYEWEVHEGRKLYDLRAHPTFLNFLNEQRIFWHI